MTVDIKATAKGVMNKCREHLASMQESYDEHMGFALRVSFILFSAGFLLLVHALIPAWFQCSASTRIFKLADEIRARQAKCRAAQSHDL